VIPELGNQFIPGIAGTKGPAFEPLDPVMEQARKLGLTKTIEAASKAQPVSIEELNRRLQVGTEKSGLIQPKPKGGETTNVQKEKEGVQVAPTAEPPVNTLPEVPSAPKLEVLEKVETSLLGNPVTIYKVKSEGIGGETTIHMTGEHTPAQLEARWKEQTGQTPASEVTKTETGKIDFKTPEGSAELHGTRPAIRIGGENGEVTIGKKESVHNDMLDPLKAKYKSEADAAEKAWKADPENKELEAKFKELKTKSLFFNMEDGVERGFVGPDGIFKSRAKAGSDLGLGDSLSSESLRDAQTGNPLVESKGEPNATQTETPVGGTSQTSTGTPPLVGEGTPGSGGQPGGSRTETTQAETPALTQETPAAPPVIPPAPPPPPKPPPKDYSRDPGSPIGIKNADINKLRVSMGLEPIEKAVGMPDAETWQRVMDRIDQDKDWIDTIIKDIKETGRGHTADEALALDHRLVEIRTEFDKAARESAKAHDAGDVVAEAQAKIKVNLWSDKLAELSQVTTSSGTSMGRAFRARQFRLNEDFSLAALETRKRKANDWKPLNEAERSEITKTHAEYVAKTKELEAHLAEQSGKRVDAEIKLAAAEAARGPEYDPQLLKLVERVASFMDKAAVSAMDRITQRRKGGQVRMDPSLGTLDLAADLVDASIIGAAKIARKINDFTIWSDAMRKHVGEWIIPHLKEVWESSKAQVPKSVDDSLKAEKPDTKAKAKAALTGQDVAEKIEAAKDKIQAKVEKGQQNAIFYQVQELVRGIVERDPKITRGQLINEVHGVLKEFMPDIEKMDTMDAITGVGRFTTPKQDIVSKTVRELKTQTRLASHFIRVLMKEELPRTGYQHEKPSDVSRSLTRRINEAKRKFPLEPSDPESQLGSILQSRKTYYTHRMADLQAEIKARKRKVKTTTPSPTDSELDALIEKYDIVKRDHDAMFGDPKITDANRLKLLESSATRRIAELERQLKMDEVFSKSKRPSTLSSEKLVALRTRIDALVAERDYVRMRAEPDPGMDPFVMAIINARARITRKIADYTQRVADGDYAPRTRKPPVDITQDKQAMSLMADLQKVKRDFDKGLALDEAKKRTKFVKFMAGAGEVLNLPRAVWSAFDLSAVGRQGATMLMGHPIRSAKSVIPMFKALFSEKAALIEEQKIINRPNYQNGNYAKSDLYLASLDEFRLNRQEEIMMSRFANLIPGVRASNRAFMTYLNKLRADSFDVMLKSRERWFTKPVEQFEKDAISNYINISTGRGNLGNHAAAAQTLATVFWAPRLMASRIQYLVGQPLWKGGARVRTMIAKEYAQTLMGMGAVMGLASMSGAEIETNPNSSDFLKLKFGKARVDIMGGLLQNVVFLNRLLISGKIKTASGKEKPIKAGDLIWNFARNKFTPAIGTGLDVRDIAFGQKPPAGHPQTLGDLVLNLPVPLSFRDVFTLLREEGVPATSALTLVSLFGWGVQYYDALAGEKPSAKPSYPDSMFRPPTRRAIQP
jgi:hypothetical protein